MIFKELRCFRRKILSLCRSALLSLFLVFLYVGPVTAQSYLISKVQIVGTERIEPEAVRAQLEHLSGKISRTEIAGDVKNIYRTGFFDLVNAQLVSDGGGRQILRYVVVEKPAVRKVFIKGNEELDEDDLAEVFSFGPRRFLDKTKIHFLIQSAKTLYQSKGFHDAEFEHSVVPVGDNQVDITFTIDEGKRYQIQQVRIIGADKMSESELLSVMQTTDYKWWSSWLFGTGRLNKEMLENDKLLLRQFFLDNGFLDATLSEPAIEKKDDGLYITFHLTEGEEYDVGEISISGDLINDNASETLDGIESEQGDTFSASVLRQDSFTISNKFTDIGFAFANVTPQTRVNRANSTVDIQYVVDKGKPVLVRRINIRGNTKTYDHVIRRTLRINEQEKFSSSKIQRSRQLLERLGYFDEVNITTENTEKEDEVDLTVRVREGSTGTFSAGAGYSSGEGALFNARLSENNIMGTGRRFVINADLGTQRENLILSLVDPRFQNTYWSLGTELLRTERVFPDFDRQMTGGSLSAGYPLDEIFGEWAQDINYSMKYEYLDIDITDVDVNNAAQLVIDEEGRTTSSSVTPRLVRNTINNPLNPTDGSMQSVEFEFAGLGGEEEFYLFEARNQWYEPLFDTEAGPWVFSWRARLGYGDSFNDDPFPLFRRYFPGGINSNRGFRARTLGPKDENGNEYGGSKQFINNFEVIFPLASSAGLRGVMFFDAGEAFDDDVSITLSDLRQAYGAGLRWNSPLGPIRIEVGFPIDREEGEDSVVTLFAFGAPL